MMNTLESGDGWSIEEDMLRDVVRLVVYGEKALFRATELGCTVLLPAAAIDALRAMQPRFLPHLREQRAAIFSERSKKGWQTRRNENKAQKDADIKTLIGLPADAPKSLTEIRGT